MTQNLAPVWPGPCLTVPITVDCLLVGVPDQSSTWAATAVNYVNLKAGLPALSSPFAPGTPPPTGAHVMWTIPFALRHGHQKQDDPNKGALLFPYVPNRWLVTRTYYGAPGASPPPAPQLVATVIQSDLLTPQSQLPPGVSQYPVTPTANAPITVMQIGGAFALPAWTGPAGPDVPFLTAMGPAEVSWSAIYDDVRNVFSLYDPLTGAAPGTYSYSVTGWYADPAADPLQGLPVDDPQKWLDAVTKQFSWSVTPTSQLSSVTAAQAAWTAWQTAHGMAGGTFDPSKATLAPQLLEAITQWAAWQTQQGVAGVKPALPQQMLCAGLVAQIPWQGAAYPYGTGAPNKDQFGNTVYPAVAVGNSAVEATAAWLAETYVSSQHGAPFTVADIERAIEAFQRGFLLELYSDPVAAEAKLHAAEFVTQPAGAQWIVVRPADDAGQAEPSKTAGQETVPLNADQTQALTALNAAQTVYDAAAAVLVSQQSELFALLYKSIKIIFRGLSQATQQLVTAAYAALTQQLEANQAQLVAYDAAVIAAQAALTALLAGKDAPAYDLLRVAAPRVSAPSDPVLMIAGLGTDSKFAPPGTYGDDDTVPCRFSGQTVTGITVAVPGVSQPVTLLAADVLAPISTFPQGQPIPKEAQDFWLELVFLDPSAAPFLAFTALTKVGVTPTAAAVAALAATIVQQQQAPFAASQSAGLSPQAVAEASWLQGVLPAPTAVTYHNGKQPWTPVAMDWQVAWYPSATDPAAQIPNNWSLDAVDYVWKGVTPVPAPAPACASITNPPPPQPVQLQGRTPLNPKTAADIGKALATFASADDPNYAALPQYVRDALDAAATILGRFDVMTQSMSGFTQQLLLRSIAPSADPTNPAQLAMLGNAPVRFAPVPGQDDGCPHPFFPVRAGHFTLQNMWVIDSYGQILRGVDPSFGIALPIRAQSVTTRPDGTNPDKNAAFVELPPRVSQTARVDLTLLDAQDDGIVTNSSDATSPICGWVVPNHLDASLMVFSADGRSKGAILKVATDLQSSGLDTGLRWDAPPGSDLPLGAPPNVGNAHLQGFVTALLRRGVLEGSAPLETLLDHVDSVLFANAPLGPPDRNVSALLGAPLAVVRARVAFELAGWPAFDQSWASTGANYVGAKPVAAPLLSVPFGIRIGDMAFGTNGVMGYFVAGDYDTFYAVYGAGGQTAQVVRAVRGGVKPQGGLARLLANGDAHTQKSSSYVQTGHLVPLTPSGTPVYVTLLVDPRGMIPIVSGIAPVVTVSLAPGPVSSALRAMTASFRVGPLLVDPRAIKMPLPSEVRGNWNWVARTDVTSWSDPQAVAVQDAVATLQARPPRLSEGWLTLAAMYGPRKDADEQER
jgi:hypothetical protein